jgi:hypothetical protein
MRARAAQRRSARQVLGSVTKVARRTFPARRPLAHPSGEPDLAAPAARVPAQRDHEDAQVAAELAGQR